jgi:hypothetical protein
VKDDNVLPLHRPTRVGPAKPVSPWVDQMRSMLATEKLHEQEAKAIGDEQEFCRRFRAPWPRRDREALLDLQLEIHLSDHDARWLIRSKSLAWRDGRMNVLDPLWVRLSGWFYIGALWFMLGVPMLGGAHLTGYSDRSILLLGAGSVALLFASRFLWLLFLFPHQVRKRIDEHRTARRHAKTGLI